MAEAAEALYRSHLYTAAVPVDTSGGYARGLDVSQWQGKVNWAKVARAGYAFAMVRASVGLKRDPTYWRNDVEARQAGLLVGPYHFLTAHDSPMLQAGVFTEALRPGHALPAWVDVETYQGEGPSQGQAKAFVHTCWERGLVRLGIYTSAHMLAVLGHDPGWASELPHWMADWARAREGKPRRPKGWRWDFQQTTSHGQVAGIQGRVDLDIYRGTREELVARYGGSA